MERRKIGGIELRTERSRWGEEKKEESSVGPRVGSGEKENRRNRVEDREEEVGEGELRK